MPYHLTNRGYAKRSLDDWVTPRLAAGYPSNLISLEEFTIKLCRPLRFKPRGRYNLIAPQSFGSEWGILHFLDYLVNRVLASPAIDLSAGRKAIIPILPFNGGGDIMEGGIYR